MGLVAPNWALEGSVSIGAFAVSLWCNGDKLSLSFGFPLLQDTGPIFPSHRASVRKDIMKSLEGHRVGKRFYFLLKRKMYLISVVANICLISVQKPERGNHQGSDGPCETSQSQRACGRKLLVHESFPEGRRGSFHLSVARPGAVQGFGSSLLWLPVFSF